MDPTSAVVVSEPTFMDACHPQQSIVVCCPEKVGILVPACVFPPAVNSVHVPHLGDDPDSCHGILLLDQPEWVWFDIGEDCVVPELTGTNLIFKSAVNWEAGAANSVISRGVFYSFCTVCFQILVMFLGDF